MTGEKVILASLPFAPITHPSMALSCLSAALKERGIQIKCIYPSFEFAEIITLSEYLHIINYNIDYLLGDWIFSKAAFPDLNANDDEYFDKVIHKNKRRAFLDAREAAVLFIEKLAEQIVEMSPRILACSSMFCQNCASLALMRKVKEKSPEIVTVMGGANCEGEMGIEIHRRFNWVDYIFSGEADKTFADLCLKLINGEDIGTSGIRYHESILTPYDRNISAPLTLTSERVSNLSELPVPDHDDYFNALEKSRIKNSIKAGLLAETSRGCWWGEKTPCTFCGLNGSSNKYRLKEAEKIKKELAELSAKYGTSLFQMTDNALSHSCFDDLLPELSKEKPILFYEVKPYYSRTQTKALADCGVKWVQAGIESLNDNALRLLNKGVTAYQNVRFLKWCREYGIFVAWNYLTTIPGEEDKWNIETAEIIPLLSHLQPPTSNLSPVRFDRYSRYHSNPDAYGISLKEAVAYSYVYPDDNNNGFEKLAYFFYDELSVGKEKTYGQDLLDKRLLEWIKLFPRSLIYKNEEIKKCPSLTMTRSETENIIITDTRPIASKQTHLLDKLSSDIYDICDEGATKKYILTELQNKGFTETTEKNINCILQQLVEDKLILKLGEHYLSLSVNDKRLPYYSIDLIPGGRIIAGAKCKKVPDVLSKL